MGDKTLLRPDGTRLVVPSDRVKPLIALGYKEETLDQAAMRHAEEGKEEYFTTGVQQLKTGAEGLASGLTLGLSDIALEGMGADTAERAKHNPGVRIGAELVGGLLPVAPGGVGKFFTLTPAGFITKGATAAAGKVTGAAKKGMVAGMVEGAGAGLQQEIAHKTLNGEPLTVEGALAGIGWGTIFGGGIGGFAGMGAGKLEARAAKQAADKTAAIKSMQDDAWAHAATSEKWGNMRSTFKEIGTQTDEALKLARKHMETSAEIYGQAQTKAATEHANALAGNLPEMQAAVGEAKTYLNTLVSEGKIAEKGVRTAHKAAVKAHDRLKKALKAKDFEKIDELTEEFRTSIDDLHRLAPPTLEGTPASGLVSSKGAKPTIPSPRQGDPRIAEAQHTVDPEIMLKAEGATKAYEELASLGLSADVLKRIPTTPQGFATMAESKLERLQAATEKFLATKTPEFQGLRESLQRSIEDMSTHLGIQVEGDVGAQLRGVWETMKGAGRKSTHEATEKVLSSNRTPWALGQVKAGAGRMASEYARTQGGGPFMQGASYSMAGRLVEGIIALKTGVVGAITSRALAWAPHAIAGIKTVGPKVEPFLTRLDGMQDDAADRHTLFKKRQAEILGAAGAVRDTLYKSISPLTVEHPEFALGLFNHANTQFQFLVNKIPKDPGHAFNKLKTLWKPDPVAMEKFSRYYEVFQNPVAVINRALDSLKITPEAAEGLQHMWPALWTHLRVEALNRISDPAIMEKLSYEEQVAFGTLLDIKLHSSMSPRFIASQQQMFAQRKELLPMPPQPGAEGGKGGRPSGPASSPYASAGQKVTAR